MKKTILSLVAIGLLLAPIVGLAVAVTGPQTRTAEATLAVLDTIVNYVFGIFIVIAVLCFVLAGFTFVTAAGDPEKVSKARNYLLYGLIGVLVALLSRGLVNLVSKISGGGGVI